MLAQHKGRYVAEPPVVRTAIADFRQPLKLVVRQSVGAPLGAHWPFTLADRNGQSRKPSRSRATNQSAKVAGLALVAMWPDRLGFSVLLFLASVGTTSEVARRFALSSFAT